MASLFNVLSSYIFRLAVAVNHWLSPARRVALEGGWSDRGRLAMPFGEGAFASRPGVLPLWVVVALAIAYVFPGLTDYGPWKPDEPYVFGMVHSLMQSGDWVVPMLAGEPFMEKPPLYMWAAAITATLSSPWLSPEHGARLAIGGFMFVTLISLGLAARRWWGPGQGRLAALALLGSLGLAQHGHMMIPDLPLLTGFAVALLGFSWIADHPRKGGLLLGTGIGIAFMGKGVLGLAGIGATAVFLPVAFRGWRTGQYARGLMFAALAASPWLLLWPAALYIRSPELFMEWFWFNNVGRFLGFSVAALGAAHDPGFMPSNVPWFTFPALPLAAWVLWTKRQTLLTSAACQVNITMFAIMFVTLTVSASARAVYLLPLLAPLAILAAPGAAQLTRRFDAIADWFARALFGALVALVWGVTIWFAVSGRPPAWSVLARHLPMDFSLQLSAMQVLAALALLAAWMTLMPRMQQIRGRGLLSWTSGVTVLWGTLFALLLPWMDAAKSYQATFNELNVSIPVDAGCVASKGLGESERGMFHYVTGIVSRRVEITSEPGCEVLLQQGISGEPPHYAAEEGWRLIWEGSRPGEHRERFWLFVRAHEVAEAAAAIHDAGSRQGGL